MTLRFMPADLLEKILVAALSLLKYTCAPSIWSISTAGMVPSTCRAKFCDLTTSTVETSESTMSESRFEFSTVTAFALPLIMTVVLLHLLMRMECEMDASISMGCGSLSKFSCAAEISISRAGSRMRLGSTHDGPLVALQLLLCRLLG